ncbi:uncharacterized protein LOC123916121 isoform X2 [Trifolium pratense]|uniref:Uncharacterized protein n=1 Tax=Trifolium pratense TaxID=57577 RepID=A0ACB0M836_TRIPR|nr:uncharacterized protein LOC123916121 isoform X2 [Trifolium pratense]CAJ2677698.1 unnamed protein product [Trifolium pratense]
MLGTALQFGGVRGDDRFYIPVKARKNQNQRKQAQKAKNGEEEIVDSISDNNNNNNNNNQSLYSTTTVPSVESVSNIDRFLDSTKLLVPAQYFSKTTMRGWKTCDVEYQSYFPLNDLWESFKEWSAYGAGVPLLLDQRESVVQYYVPYLSAIQLYGQPTEKSNAKPRYASEDSDGDYYRDSCSEGSSDCDYGKRTECFTAQRSSKHSTSGVSSQMSTLSIHDKHNTVQEGFSSSDDSETGNPQELLFQYLEQGHPYSREPLTDKILDLARDYPALMSLRSCDLLPTSWMSVAWYPIYRIPTGPTLKDLDACFLTYHTLHTPLTGSAPTPGPTLVYPSEMDGVPNISIPTFAMAAYKLKGSIWMKKEVGDNEVMNSLLQAADKWLRLVQVTHPDHQFFKSHGTYYK